MDTVATVALPLAVMGFIFGLTALGQVSQLKKEVQELKNKPENE